MEVCVDGYIGWLSISDTATDIFSSEMKTLLMMWLITSLSAYAGVVSLIVIIPAIILVQCMFASLVSGRLKLVTWWCSV
jgi:hypothetical protein